MTCFYKDILLYCIIFKSYFMGCGQGQFVSFLSNFSVSSYQQTAVAHCCVRHQQSARKDRKRKMPALLTISRRFRPAHLRTDWTRHFCAKFDTISLHLSSRSRKGFEFSRQGVCVTVL